MTTKLLLDTDIDVTGDIDDALCLAYLLAQPACELLGITTVTWDTARRAMVASALCRAAGRDVPVLPGACEPLLLPLPQVGEGPAGDPEGELLSRWPHEERFPESEAVAFMRQVIRRHPGEVTLLAIGPLTNVALLFAVDPEIPALLKGLVVMAGVFAGRPDGAGLREWNALVDPHAAAMVYRAPVRRHRSVGLDVTAGLRLDAGEVWRRLGDRREGLLAEMLEVWFRQSPAVTFHDPLAAAAIFDEGVCRFERGAVEVELQSDRLAGLTHWLPGESGLHEVALGVDSERFYQHYFSVITR
jgi:purine nucleosidase